MANFFYTDAKGQKHLLTPAQVRALAARGIIKPDTPLESDNGHKGLAGQIRGLFASTEPQTEPQSLDCEKRNTQTEPRSVEREIDTPRSSERGSVSRSVNRRMPTTVGVAIILLAVTISLFAWNSSREPATASRYQSRAGALKFPKYCCFNGLHMLKCVFYSLYSFYSRRSHVP